MFKFESVKPIIKTNFNLWVQEKLIVKYAADLKENVV
jgi:hypothetical protein